MQTTQRGRIGMVVVPVLFLASGVAGLIYELVWTRMLVLVFGNTLLATSTVLSAYMAGLAGGGYVVGRLVDRRARRLLVWYGALELGIGLFALAFPHILAAFAPGYRALYRILAGDLRGLTAIRFLACFLLIAIPTFLMGGTLPILVKHFTSHAGALGKRVGLLYGLNTLGAVAGCVLCGFYLLKFLGMNGASLVAVAINLSVAACAFLLGRQPGRPGQLAAGAPHRPAVASSRVKLVRPQRSTVALALAAIGISGFCSLAYQVFWTRLLSLFLQNSVYSFTIILATFLSGLALGSLLYYSLLARFARQAWLLAALEMAIGAASLGATYFFIARSTAVFSPLSPSLSLLKAAALILGPTVLIGATLPLATEICRRGPDRDGQSVGRVYAINTIGSVLGACLAGFVLLPLLGLQRSIAAVAILNALAGVLLLLSLLRGGHRLGAAAGAAAGALAIQTLVPGDLLRQMYQASQPDAELVAFQEGAVANVVVWDFWKEGYQDLYLNRVEEASSRLWHVQLFKLLGILPPLVHQQPDNALMIAFGAGMSAGATAQVVERLDCVDLNPDIQGVAQAFRQENLDVLHDPRFRFIVNDGRNQLFLTPEKYSVIISDATHPMTFDSWTLYSKDFYALVKSRLKPGGVFAQWLPIPLSGDALPVILRTFKSVFPHTSFWVIHGSSQCLMLATPTRLHLDYQELQRRLAPLRQRAGLDEYGISDAEKLLSFFFFGEDAADRFLADSTKVSTDDLPHPQFSPNLDRAGLQASLDLLAYQETAEPYLWNTGADGPRLQRDLRRHLAVNRALNRGFLTGNPLEFEKAVFMVEGTPLAADENVKSGLRYDRKREDYFAKRIAKFPGEFNAHNSLGYVFLKKRQYPEAIAAFSRALELKPNFAKAALNLARAYTAAGQYDDAVAQWLRVKAMNPTASTLDEAAGQLDLIHLLRLLSHRPADPDLYQQLVNLHLRQRRPIDAIRALRQAVAAAPGDGRRLSEMAEIYSALGLPEEALAAYRKASTLLPEDEGLRRRVEALQRDPPEARKEPAETAAASPLPPASKSDTDYQAAMQVWDQYPYDGTTSRATLERAARMMRRILERDPAYMKAYVSAATLYEALGQYDDAAGVLAKGLAVSPGFQAAKDQQEKLEWLAKLRRGQLPAEELLATCRALGQAYWKTGELEPAMRYLERALQLAPDDASGWTNLGLCYLRAGLVERAREALSRALALAPGSTEIRTRLAQVEGLLGERVRLTGRAGGG